jgi:hypothetical protein
VHYWKSQHIIRKLGHYWERQHTIRKVDAVPLTELSATLSYAQFVKGSGKKKEGGSGSW